MVTTTTHTGVRLSKKNQHEERQDEADRLKERTAAAVSEETETEHKEV